jgi:hypothetical protein
MFETRTQKRVNIVPKNKVHPQQHDPTVGMQDLSQQGKHFMAPGGELQLREVNEN